MGVLRRLHERDAENGVPENPNILWGSEYNPPAPRWEVGLGRDWSDLGVGVSWQRQYGTEHWPDWWSFVLDLGPWSLWLRREWGNSH